MTSVALSTCVCLAVACCGQAETSAAEGKISLRAGDRIVLVGDGLVEQMQKSSRLESQLLVDCPKLKLTFRNLGWSGDTVRGLSRCYFDAPEEGYKRLVEQVKAARPTVLVLGYGISDSFAGSNAIDQFQKDYARLLDDIAAGVDRVLLVGPTPQAQLPSPFPDVKERNQTLSAYNRAIAVLARNRGYGFVDLFASLPVGGNISMLPPGLRISDLTQDGVQWNDHGYEFIDTILRLQFAAPSRKVSQQQFNEVRQLVAFKNALYFQRYRPQNITYLLGFRKHEQGQNAKELDELDRLVEETERKIDIVRNASRP